MNVKIWTTTLYNILKESKYSYVKAVKKFNVSEIHDNEKNIFKQYIKNKNLNDVICLDECAFQYWMSLIYGRAIKGTKLIIDSHKYWKRKLLWC